MNNTDYASNADDSTSYAIINGIEDIIQRLQAASKSFFRWFSDNKMRTNTDKCHFICGSNQRTNLIVENEEIASNICVKRLGVKIDSQFTFNIHLNNICKKAGQKLNVLARTTPYLYFNEKWLLLNTFFL